MKEYEGGVSRALVNRPLYPRGERPIEFDWPAARHGATVVHRDTLVAAVAIIRRWSMSVESPGEPAITNQLVVHRRDVPQLTVHSWSRDGTMHSAWPGDGKQVPVDGTEIKLRIVAFPGGSVREIFLDKEARTHPHPSYEAVVFYQIDGRRVQMCNEHSHEVNPGDACLEPVGVQHSTFQLIAGMFVEFAMSAPESPDPEATWITADEAVATTTDSGWSDGTADQTACSVKTFDLPGYPLIETRVARGATLAPRREDVDQLFYIVRGRLRATLADVEDEVVTGDCMRSLAGRDYAFTALDDTVLIQMMIPKAR